MQRDDHAWVVADRADSGAAERTVAELIDQIGSTPWTG